MTLTLADRVFETSTTQGTGTLNLGGAPTGFRTFVAGAGDGAEVPYVIDDGTDWEVGIGTVTAGTPDTLSRDTILASSNTDAAVNWGSGTRNVRLSPGAGVFATLRSANTWQGDNTFSAKMKLSDAGELTIDAGAVTVTGAYHTIDNEGDAATDDLDTINGGAAGEIIVLSAEHTDRTVVIKHNTGNILTPGGTDVSLSDTKLTVSLIYLAALSKWVVIAANDYATAAQGALAESAVQPGDAFSAPLLHVQDQKAANTAGGTFTSGAWRTRTLNTVVTNEITGASLSSNQITLPAGTYHIEASAPGYICAEHKAKLRNTSDSEDTLIGSSEFSVASGSTQTRSFVIGRFTIAAEKVFEIQHQCNTSGATSGLGRASNFSVIEVYADVKIWKVA